MLHHALYAPAVLDLGTGKIGGSNVDCLSNCGLVTATGSSSLRHLLPGCRRQVSLRVRVGGLPARSEGSASRNRRDRRQQRFARLHGLRHAAPGCQKEPSRLCAPHLVSTHDDLEQVLAASFCAILTQASREAIHFQLFLVVRYSARSRTPPHRGVA